MVALQCSSRAVCRGIAKVVVVLRRLVSASIGIMLCASLVLQMADREQTALNCAYLCAAALEGSAALLLLVGRIRAGAVLVVGVFDRGVRLACSVAQEGLWVSWSAVVYERSRRGHSCCRTGVTGPVVAGRETPAGNWGIAFPTGRRDDGCGSRIEQVHRWTHGARMSSVHMVLERSGLLLRRRLRATSKDRGETASEKAPACLLPLRGESKHASCSMPEPHPRCPRSRRSKVEARERLRNRGRGR